MLAASSAMKLDAILLSSLFFRTEAADTTAVCFFRSERLLVLSLLDLGA
jgi:hypothetical protein